MKVLQTVFCILACLLVAAAIPVGTFFGWVWFAVLAAAAALCAGAMFCVKKLNAPKEPPRADFMNSDEENARINRENKDGQG